MWYLTAKTLHIVGFVSWFAGLLYMVRLFIYHAEAEHKEQPSQDILQRQFELMQWRLWYIITCPAMVVTLVGGVWMLVIRGGLEGWLHAKLGFVGALLGYHWLCGRVRKKQQEQASTWSAYQLRVLNEGATLLLVAIVCVAVFRTAWSALWGNLVLVGLGILMMLGIRLYRRVRVDS